MVLCCCKLECLMFVLCDFFDEGVLWWVCWLLLFFFMWSCRILFFKVRVCVIFFCIVILVLLLWWMVRLLCKLLGLIMYWRWVLVGIVMRLSFILWLCWRVGCVLCMVNRKCWWWWVIVCIRCWGLFIICLIICWIWSIWRLLGLLILNWLMLMGCVWCWSWCCGVRLVCSLLSGCVF